jgi:hypothetical protein
MLYAHTPAHAHTNANALQNIELQIVYIGKNGQTELRPNKHHVLSHATKGMSCAPCTPRSLSTARAANLRDRLEPATPECQWQKQAGSSTDAQHCKPTRIRHLMQAQGGVGGELTAARFPCWIAQTSAARCCRPGS